MPAEVIGKNAAKKSFRRYGSAKRRSVESIVCQGANETVECSKSCRESVGDLRRQTQSGLCCRQGRRGKMQHAGRRFAGHQIYRVVDRTPWPGRKGLFVPCRACDRKPSRAVSKTVPAIATKSDVWSNHGRSRVLGLLYFCVSVIG